MIELDETLVARVLDAFYARVRRDPMLRPVFEAIIGNDWTAHMEDQHLLVLSPAH